MGISFSYLKQKKTTMWVKKKKKEYNKTHDGIQIPTKVPIISAASWQWFCSTQHVKYKQRVSACVSVIVATLDSLVNYEL